MSNIATLVSLEPVKKVNQIPVFFNMLGVEAPKETYDDKYELLLDVDRALRDYENRTGRTISVQSIAWGSVQREFSTKEVLKKILEKKEYRLLGRLGLYNSLFDQETCDLYGEEILQTVLNSGRWLIDLSRNELFFKKCIELCRKDLDYCKLLFGFAAYFFKPEVREELIKEHEIYAEYALAGNIEEVNKYLPELFTKKEIYSIYVQKVKENERYLPYIIASPLLADYYLEVKDIIIKNIEARRIPIPGCLKKNIDFLKDCLTKYDLSDPYFKGFNKRVLIQGIADKKFTFEEISKIMQYCNINGTVENIVRKIDYLYKLNDEFTSTLMVQILDSKYDCISLESLEKIVTDSDLQGIIIDLGEDKITLVDTLLKKMNRKDIDLSNVIFSVISKLDDTKDEYEEFLNLVNRIDINSLDDEQLNNLILVLSKDSNMYKVTSALDLKEENFQKLRKAYIDEIDKKIENGTIDIEELRAALFEKKYGLDYTQAKFIYRRYCSYFNGIKIENPRIKELLTSIAKIMKEKEIDVLVQLYKLSERIITDFYSVVSLESCIRREYAKEYSDTLFRVDEHPEQLTRREASYEGEEVLVYDLHGDFRMQVHALGAYIRGEWTRPDDFAEDWLRPKIQSHGVCTCYIGNSQIATARPNGPILGFSQYEESALLVGGNYDLGSARDNKQYSVSMHRPYRLLPPKSMMDFTRHNHNEMVIERRNISSQGDFKRRPDYVVYIVDDANDPKNFSKDNDYYQQTLQAARDFGIPVIVIDRLAYAKSELKSALAKEKEVYETGNLEVLKEAFMIYANNEVACRLFPEFDSNGVRYMPEPKEYQKIFNAQATKDFVGRVINNVLVSGLSNNQKIDVLRRLWVLMSNEHVKFEGVRMDIRIDYSDLLKRVNSELMNLGSEEIKIGK